MREKFLLYSLLAILSLWIICTSEVRAQSAVSEIVLREGITTAHPRPHLLVRPQINRQPPSTALLPIGNPSS